MDGFLLVNKPAGISSFGVVAKVRYLLSQQAGHKVKVGHTGTLDPAATGLLIIVTGAYCKLASEFSKLGKTYMVELTLGATSTTADVEGEITQISDSKPPQSRINAVLAEFVGEQQQVPPAFSAVKIDGQRAYKLARAGKDVQIEPRQVNIHSITNIEYNYPKLSFITEVSSGTYIRSLAVDIGEALGIGAYMSGLTRTQIKDYQLGEAVDLDQLNAEIIQANLKRLPNHP